MASYFPKRKTHMVHYDDGDKKHEAAACNPVDLRNPQPVTFLSSDL